VGRPTPTGYVDAVAAAEIEDAALRIDWADIYDLYPQQYDFCCGSDCVYQLWIAARGTGKTYVLTGPKTVYLALSNPGTFLPGGRIKYTPGAMLGRTMDEVEAVHDGYFLDAVQRFEQATGISLIAWYNGKLSAYTLVNGAQIYQRSYGRRDSMKKNRGRTYAWATVDEMMFAEVDSQEAFMTIAATLRHPAPKRQLAVATSPDGYRGVVSHFMTKWLDGDPRFFITTATVHDNPHIDEEYRQSLRAGCTDRQWKAEGEGKVLRPMRTVYAEYTAAKHVIPWQWDSSLPWCLAVDWGESWGWVGAFQVVDRDGYYNAADRRRRLPRGTWVAADEWVMVDGSRPAQRRKIVEMINEHGYPTAVAADRAVRTENQWLATVVGDDAPVLTLVKKDEQKRSWGIGCVSYMLDPGDGKPPRLYLADTLDGSIDEKRGTLRSALSNYKYREFRLDSGDRVITNTPETNTPPTHAADATRYILSCTAYDERLHGGRPLPYVQTPAHLERNTSTSWFDARQNRTVDAGMAELALPPRPSPRRASHR